MDKAKKEEQDGENEETNKKDLLMATKCEQTLINKVNDKGYQPLLELAASKFIDATVDTRPVMEQILNAGADKRIGTDEDALNDVALGLREMAGIIANEASVVCGNDQGLPQRAFAALMHRFDNVLVERLKVAGHNVDSLFEQDPYGQNKSMVLSILRRELSGPEYKLATALYLDSFPESNSALDYWVGGTGILFGLNLISNDGAGVIYAIGFSSAFVITIPLVLGLGLMQFGKGVSGIIGGILEIAGIFTTSTSIGTPLTFLGMSITSGYKQADLKTGQIAYSKGYLTLNAVDFVFRGGADCLTCSEAEKRAKREKYEECIKGKDLPVLRKCGETEEDE